MAFEWAWNWHVTPYFFAAASLILLAGWLLFLSFPSRLNRTFAVLLILRAGELLMFTQSQTVDSLWGRARSYFLVAIPFAALYFAYAYRRHYALGPTWTRRVPAWAALTTIAGAAAVVLLLLAHDRTLYHAMPPRPGALTFMDPLVNVSYAGIAILFVHHAWRSPVAACHGALYLAALGFALTPTYVANFLLWDLLAGVWLDSPFGREIVYYPWFLFLRALDVLPLALILVLWGLFVHRARALGTSEARREAAVFSAWVVPPIIVGILLAFMLNHTYVNDPRSTFFGWLAGLRTANAAFAMALPVIIGYALVRHHFFDLDWRLKITIARSAVGGAFLATFFVISEGAALALSEQAGPFGGWAPYIGVGGAGLLLFFLHPLQRYGERLAHRLMPNSKPVTDMSSPERLSLYREQAELAWLDRTLHLKERLLLDQLRERLGIPHEAAARIESEAMEAIMGRSPPAPTGRRRASVA